MEGDGCWAPVRSVLAVVYMIHSQDEKYTLDLKLSPLPTPRHPSMSLPQSSKLKCKIPPRRDPSTMKHTSSIHQPQLSLLTKENSSSWLTHCSDTTSIDEWRINLFSFQNRMSWSCVSCGAHVLSWPGCAAFQQQSKHLVLKVLSFRELRSHAEKHESGTAVSVMVVHHSASFVVGCIDAAGVEGVNDPIYEDSSYAFLFQSGPQ